jgi:integrase
MSELLDCAGRRRSPATTPEFHAGRSPGNKDQRYPADPPKVEEIIAVMRAAGDTPHGRRLRGLIVILWRAGLRLHEALALAEADLDHRRGSLLVRRGKGGRRREVGMDAWGWDELQPWLAQRLLQPIGSLFCVINGPTRGRTWSGAAARADLASTAQAAGVRRRFAPPPAAPRPRRRDGPRRRPADRHSTPARTQQPRHHLDLFARHRQRRNHRHRAWPPPADDPRQYIATAIADAKSGSCFSRKAALRSRRAALARRRWRISLGANPQ